jgi:hypothetical protein
MRLLRRPSRLGLDGIAVSQPGISGPAVKAVHLGLFSFCLRPGQALPARFMKR